MWAGLWVEVFGTTPGNSLKQMVGVGGLEPPTSPLSGARSSHRSYRPTPGTTQNFSRRSHTVQPQPANRAFERKLPLSLHETYIRSWPASFGRFFNRTELRLIPAQIFPQRPPDSFCMPRADDRAGQKFSLRAIGKNVDKIQRELFQVVMNHHQVAVLPLQFLFIRLDFHLPPHSLLFVHLISLPPFPF